MSLEPLLTASPIIQIHAFAAIAAFGLGGWVLFRKKKGDAHHRTLGKLWVALMVIVAVSSLFIWTIRIWGPFSPIHLISIATLVGLYRAVQFARQRNIKAHMNLMKGLYVGALVVAGIFTFLPGRTMSRVVFGPDGADPIEFAILLVVVALCGLVGLALANRRKLNRWRRRLAAA